MPAINYSSHDKKALFLATSLGVGNFLLLPKLFSHYDFRLVLFFHLLSLFILGAPLLVAELIWGRWLRRNPIDAFSFLKSPLRYTPYISLLTLAGLSPLYIIEVKNILFWSLNVWTPNALFTTPPTNQSLGENLLKSLLGIAVIIGLLIPVIKLTRLKIRQFFFKSLLVAGVFLTLALIFQPLKFWQINIDYIFKTSKNLSINKNLLLDVTALSLFTLSVGLGIHYWFVTWLSPIRRTVEEMQHFWKRPGRIHRLVLQIIFFDFSLTLIASLFLIPWLSLMPTESAEITFSSVFLNWWPEYLQTYSSGIYVMRFLSIALFILGFLSLSTLVLLGIYSTRLIVGIRSTGSAILTLSYIGIMGLVASVPVFMSPLESLTQDLLLPLAALMWSLTIGFNMPNKDIFHIVGRSPVSDALTSLWKVSLKYFVPSILLSYLIFRISSWIGTTFAVNL